MISEKDTSENPHLLELGPSRLELINVADEIFRNIEAAFADKAIHVFSSEYGNNPWSQRWNEAARRHKKLFGKL